jgi:hypothetical protein
MFQLRGRIDSTIPPRGGGDETLRSISDDGTLIVGSFRDVNCAGAFYEWTLKAAREPWGEDIHENDIVRIDAVQGEACSNAWLEFGMG